MFKVKKKKMKISKRQKPTIASRLSVLMYPLYGLFSVVVIGGVIWGYLRADVLEEDLHHWAMRTTQECGFRISDVVVEGRVHAAKTDIIDQLKTHSDAPIFAFDPHAARQGIESLEWIETATVTRELPDMIRIHVTERHPSALWQNQGHHYVVDANGRVIDGQKASAFQTLPIIIGREAPQNSRDLLLALENHPRLVSKMKAAIHQRGKRWDLRLADNFDVKLPEDNIPAALDRFADLEKDYGVTTKDILVVDLRSPNKLILRLKPEAIKNKRVAGQNA